MTSNRCIGKVHVTAHTSRQCRLRAVPGSSYCRYHSSDDDIALIPDLHKELLDVTSDALDSGYPEKDTPCQTAHDDITVLLNDAAVWDAIDDYWTPRMNLHQNADQLILKDLYITETIRRVVQPSEACGRQCRDAACAVCPARYSSNMQYLQLCAVQTRSSLALIRSCVCTSTEAE